MKFYLKILQELKDEPKTMQTVYQHAFSFQNEVAFEYNRNLIVYRISYAECRKEILRISSAIDELFPNQSVIAIAIKNSPLWVECFWAILLSGRKVMPVSSDLPKKTLEQSLQKANCHALIGAYEIHGSVCIAEDVLRGYTSSSPRTTEPADGWGNEVILSTSGTTGTPEVFSYTGLEICNQILNSEYVLHNCKDISRFWKGQFRQLAFLPFSHIFGLTACYLWFAIFGRTFVFLEDYSPATILRTCRLHHVTHIFAVPALWDTLADGIVNEAANSNQSDRLNKGIEISLKIQDLSPWLGRLLVPLLMKEVQEKTLGVAVRFCISGGGICRKKTFQIINGCGYHLENGYGMTEIGIVSVTLKKKARERTGKTVGSVFPSVIANIDAHDHLLINGTSCFAYQYTDGTAKPRIKDEWFDTGDCFSRTEDGELIIKGRSDDLINASDGERINPEMIESLLDFDFSACVVNASDMLTMIVEAPGEAYISREYRKKMIDRVNDSLSQLPIALRPKKILYTYEKIPVSLSYKFRRKEIVMALAESRLQTMTAESFLTPDDKKTDSEETYAVVNEIISIVKKVLAASLPVTPSSDFFQDLGGDSLSYLEYLNEIEQHFRIQIPKAETGKCTTPISTYSVISGAIEVE